jgi:hypothetical protein
MERALYGMMADGPCSMSAVSRDFPLIHAGMVSLLILMQHMTFRTFRMRLIPSAPQKDEAVANSVLGAESISPQTQAVNFQAHA